jgi:glycosyltransferase involved in cell wall biosynthesis
LVESASDEYTSVSDEKMKPLVTFALFAYNQERHIREAIESAFSQTYSPLEIILSDDCSDDNTFKIMKEMAERYSGPNIVKLNRNSVNLGLIGHVNKMFELATGDLIVAATGDDISIPSRTNTLVRAYKESEEKPFLLHSDVFLIDENGTNKGVRLPPMIAEDMDLRRIATSLALYIGASGAWHKDICRNYGSIKYKLAYEDLVFGFRAALENKILYINEPLVKYRCGSGITSKQTDVESKEIHIMEKLSSILDDRRRHILVYIDVLEQRMIDARSCKGLLNKDILSLITNALSYELARKLFYQSPLKLLMGPLIENRMLKLSAIKNEIRFILSLCKKLYFGYLKHLI